MLLEGGANAIELLVHRVRTGPKLAPGEHTTATASCSGGTFFFYETFSTENIALFMGLEIRLGQGSCVQFDHRLAEGP